MKLTLDDIKASVDRLAEKINAPEHLLPTYGYSEDGAHPHIEVDRSGQLYYVIVERGEELKRELAVDEADLLYRIFADVTFSMAVNFELKHRIEDEDCRRQIFAKQEELLGVLSDQWKQRQAKKHQLILKAHPFDDQSGIRADYSKKLRENGLTTMQAWAEACKKYPLPKAVQHF